MRTKPSAGDGFGMIEVVCTAGVTVLKVDLATRAVAERCEVIEAIGFAYETNRVKPPSLQAVLNHFGRDRVVPGVIGIHDEAREIPLRPG